MIKISKLRIKNFKSFKKATIPFSRGFTTIAGSNGSGKSNILDSLLFGMGITALKMVRASKLTDLVNHDATENYASVDVVFDDSGKEIEINRTIDKSGKSVYRLNGKRCTLSEISSMLIEMGIRPNGYNIVVQGDITRIIEMNSLQRRTIIDDVAGLREFDEKKAEAIKNLDKVEAKIKEARIVLNERIQHLEELELEKQAAIKHSELSKELKETKATILFSEIQRINKEMDALDSKDTETKKKLNELRIEREEMQRKITQFEKRIEEINDIVIKSSEKTYEGLGKEIEDKRAETRVLEEKVNAKELLIERNKMKIEDLKKARIEASEELKEKKIKLKDLADKEKELEKELKELDKKSAQLETDLEKKSEKNEVLEKEMKKISQEINSKNEEFYSVRAEQKAIVHEKETAEKNYTELKKRMERINDKARLLNEKEEERKKIESIYGSPKNKIAENNSLLDELVVQLGKSNAKKDEVSEAIHYLGRVFANCPVCDSSLPESKKNELSSQKKSLHSRLDEDLRNVKEKIDSLKEKNSKLEQARIKLDELNAALAHFEDIKEEKQDIEKQVNAIDLQELEKRAESKSCALEKIEHMIQKLNANQIELENNLNATEFKERMNSLQSLRTSTDYMKENLSVLRTDKARFEAEINEKEHTRSLFSDGSINAIYAENKKMKEEIGIEADSLSKQRKQLKEMDIELQKMLKVNRVLLEEKGKVNKDLFRYKEKHEKTAQFNSNYIQRITDIKIEKSRNEVRLVDLKEEFLEFKEENILEGKEANTLRKRVIEIEKALKGIGDVNFKAIRNYGEFKEEVDEISKKAQKLDDEREAVFGLIQKIEIRRTNVFMECFAEIDSNFQRMYNTLSGGEGKLSLSDQENPLEAGLLIEAKHTGDTLKNIESMSGGEKSLTALAFLFGIQQYEPAPFYIFDEADAALDKPNSEKLAKMIKEIASRSQFIAVSHNDALIEQSDQIIGVTLDSAKSSVIGLKIKP